MSGTPRDSNPAGAERFAPGSLLAARYRIVGPLGKGGMGEVYKAEDLKLGQSVALKFLPAEFASDPARLGRFHAEVRLAREVTHPNVCRVHDIAEAAGLHFLSMEYVDGEDLRSLLRRIGRLPRDKALEVARQLCAGLAAAHGRGVLHRDLKPANVMLDGRGRVRITDFGLASLAGGVEAREVSAGTPAYMAPEQALGKEVTVRSDLYSLGLVLYEVFTGRPAFAGRTREELLRAQLEGSPTHPSNLVEDMDAAAERVILRCLEAEPAQRPQSAFAVSAALPGGDPLAAALAAGETPSPEMVAAAGEVGSLRPKAALAWLGAAIAGAGLLYALYFTIRPSLVQRVSMDLSPDVLADRAQQALRGLGYASGFRDRAWGFEYDRDVARYLARRAPSARADAFARPAAIRFWYRESPRDLVSTSVSGIVTQADPPQTVPGMVGVETDTTGRLIALHVVPGPEAGTGEDAAPDWNALFKEAGLDASAFRAVEPQRTPPVYSDRRGAWEGTYPDRLDLPIRVEAAALKGRPVFFELEGSWTARPGTKGVGLRGIVALEAALLLTSVVLARRNLRLGRGDRRSARRLATVVFGLSMLVWVLTADHVREPFAEWTLFRRALGEALLSCGVLWVYYVALEPYVRRVWPETIVSWSRLLSGRVRDPLVGRDALIGLAVGYGSAVLAYVALATPQLTGGSPRVSAGVDLAALRGPGALLGGIAQSLLLDLNAAFLYLALLLVLRVTLRRPWVVGAVFVGATTASTAGAVALWFGSPHVVDAIVVVLVAVTMFVMATRVGLVALAASLLGPAFYLNMPAPGADLFAWYAGSFLMPILVYLGLAVYGFRTALAGQPLFKEEAL